RRPRLSLTHSLPICGLLETRRRPCEALNAIGHLVNGDPTLAGLSGEVRSALLYTVEGGAQHLDLLRGERTRLLQREKGRLGRLCIPGALLDLQFNVSELL